MMTYIDYKNVVPKAVIGLFMLLVLLIPVFTTNVATLSMLILSGLWAVAVMGFTLVLRTGQFSLGQSAFLAIGGYTSAIFTVKLGWPFWPSFLSAGVVSGVVALLVGMVVLRVGGIYFSIITLALSEIVRITAQQWESVTRGTRGLITSPPPAISLGGWEINFDASPVPYFYFTLGLVAVTALVLWRIGDSRLGGIFAGIALNPVLAEHQGMHLMKYRVLAFTVAGIFTGLAGSLYAHFLTVMTPFVFGLWQSIQIMIMSIVGGISSLVGGPVIGAIVLYTLGDYLTRLQSSGIQPLLFGAVVMLVLLFLPKGTGLVDLWGRFWTRVVWREEEFEPDEADE
ncbi:MAG: branched-chain amino acid ABC transporter permease [Deltaproteobacteria bacterium]|nr:branched-chain amino acid ABC transporter permease [Deltaproteobacteria bacterium]